MAGTEVRLSTPLFWMFTCVGDPGTLTTSCTVTLPLEFSGIPGSPTEAPSSHSSDRRYFAPRSATRLPFWNDAFAWYEPTDGLAGSPLTLSASSVVSYSRSTYWREAPRLSFSLKRAAAPAATMKVRSVVRVCTGNGSVASVRYERKEGTLTSNP